MKLTIELHSLQDAGWPVSGEHILAHFDDESIVVYQAYRPETALYALQHGHFGGPTYSFNRMSWIKPNFLWMMYRCGWATKPGQEMVVGLRIRRAFFDRILANAVASTWQPAQYASREDWKAAVEASDVRLQWDPDHDPLGAPLERRAVQLGLRGQTLKAFATSELLEVIDMTPFVHAQRPLAMARDARLLMPREQVYSPQAC
ncbi:DUF4291 domain-containing protein [Acidovorax sp.]|jgi:hypothetical protein|uniref:DUF4291 domain-containing protein n=1 Tax=Acidovorax sp. TaxID=1872122 RepID=UPI00391FB74E